MLFNVKRMLLIVMIMVITFCGVEVKAYFSFDKSSNVGFTTLGYADLTIATNKSVYGICNQEPTITLAVTNPNNYNVSYTLSFSNSNLTYKIDGANGATYTVNAASSKTHTIILSGSTTSTSLTVTVNATSPYKSSHTKTVTLDVSCPTASISSTTNVATSQTATLSCSDTEGMSSYYWGTKSSPAASEYTSQTSNLSTTKTVSSVGTYYLICKDKNGNTTSTSKIYRSYTVDNRLLNVTGSKGTYTTANYTSVSTKTYIMPNGTTIPLTSIYTTPSGGTYVGISSGTASTSAATLLSSNPTINANTTYTAWFNRNEYTITIAASVGGYNEVVTQNNTTGVVASYGNAETITLRSGESLTATAAAINGYTFTGWSGLSTGTTNSLTLTPNKTGTLTANFADKTAPSIKVIETTSAINSTSQTVTLNCVDGVGVTAYYFGTNNSPSASDYISIDSTTNFTTTKTVSSAGAYFFNCKDGSENEGQYATKVYRSYTIDNRLLTVTGTKGTYTSGNYASSSSATYIIPYGTTIPLANIYTTPTGGVHVGISNGVASSTSATLLTSNPTISANTTYTAWFNRIEYTVTVATGGNGSNKVTSQNNTTGVTATATGSNKTLTVRYGESITGTATPNSGYTFTGWSGASTSTTSPVTLTITSAKTLTANFSAKTYTITYYLGNASSTAGATSIGTSECKYGSTCGLKTWSNLGKTFPNSDYNWSFAGWSTTTSGTERTYTDGASFTYNTAGNINLYAVGARTFNFYSGLPSTFIDSETQYWNPYSTTTSYLSSITVPTAIEIEDLNFYGYRANDIASSNRFFDEAGSDKPTNLTLALDFRTIYYFNENPKIAYNANGGTGTTADTTVDSAGNPAIQYYNSGLPSGGANVSTVTFALATNGYTKTGYTFNGWGTSSSSTSGIEEGGSYVFDNGIGESRIITLYATWIDKTVPSGLSITSTNSVAASQTATIKCTDGVGVTKYYWGTKSSPSDSEYTTVTSTTSLSTTKTVSSAGTYYLICKDVAGNTSSSINKTFYKTTLNMTNGSVSPTSVITMSGNSFALPTPTASTGHTNKGAWYTSNAYSTSAGNYAASYKPTASTTLYSTATANTYTIGYSYNGGSKGANAPTSGTYNSVITIDNPSKIFTVNITNSASATLSSTSASSTQTFAGWTASNLTTSTAVHGTTTSPATSWDGTTKVSSKYFKNLRTTSGTVTFTANWTAVAVKLPTVTKNGYTCGYTATSGGSTITYASGGSYTPSTTTSSTTLYTVCTPNKIKLTLNKNGGTGGTDYVWYYYGTSVFYSNEACTTQITAITRPTRTGYTFTQYYGDGTSGGTADERYIAYDSVEFASDLATDIYKDATLYAKWTPNKIKLTLNKNGGTGGTDYVWYYYGTSVFYSNEACTTQITAITRPTRTGHTFVHYYGDGTSGGTANEQYMAYGSTEFASDLATDIYKDATLYANWSVNSYVVTYDCETNGGSGNTTASVNYNASVDLSKTCTKSGWNFEGWSTSSTATSKLSSYTMPANNATLYALYSKKVTVTFKANGCTTEDGSASGTIYNKATSVSVTVPSKSMNSGWTSLGASSSASSTSQGTAMNSSMSITGIGTTTASVTRYYNCSKAAITRSVTYSKGSNVSSIGATSGSCTIAAVYNGASQSTSCVVTLPTITANTGYTAVGWSTTNEATTGTAAGGSYTLSANTTLYANATDQTKPSCSFGSWSPTAIDVDDTATIVLTCTDTGSGVATTTLTSSNFTISDTSALSISSITTASVTNGKSYTITVTGLNKTASPTLTLKASQVRDTAGNLNTAVASAGISVTADTVGPVITFGTDGNTTPAKSHSTKVTAEDASGVSTLKYYWTQTSGSSAASGTSMTNGGTATKSSGDGTWYLCAYAVDGKGNSTDKVCTNAFVFDNTKPGISGNSTICVLKGTSFNLTNYFTVTDVNTVTLSTNKTVSTSSVGTHSVTLTATDSAGNSQTKTVTVYVYTKLTNETLVTSGSGLYADSYTSGRYLYRGSAPNNYVTFNGSSNWRIVAVNPDRTYKLVYMSSLGDMQFHSSKVNSFSGTTLETYLKGTYYSGLSNDAKNYIVSSGYYYNGNFGSASSSDTMAANVAADRATAYTGTVGLLSASDYILASTHANCTNYYYAYNKKSSVYPCSTDNYLYRASGSLWWIMNGHTNGNARCFGTTTSNAVLKNQPATNSYAVYPVVTLKNTTTFLGSGTSSNPYTICTACLQTGLSSTTCSIAIDSGDWNTSRTLTVTASSTSGITYSWDGTNYSSTRTKTISAAGTYTAFIKDSSGMINTCSFTVNSRTEYRKASCTRYWGSWSRAGNGCCSSNEDCNTKRNQTQAYAEANNLNAYYAVGQDSTCNRDYGYGGWAKWTRSCSAINCGSFGEWSTSYTYGTCTRKVETRTTYGV